MHCQHSTYIPHTFHIHFANIRPAKKHTFYRHKAYIIFAKKSLEAKASRLFLLIYKTNNGAKTSDTIAINLSNMFNDGPDVSLQGSPTVSPVTAAAWARLPFPP